MRERLEKIIIYTDGGSRNNPGPAAIGVVVKDSSGELITQYGETLGIATNNEAEYRAIISGIRKAKQLFGKEKIVRMGIEVRMDSKLAVEQLSGHYKVEDAKLQPLFMQLWNLRVELGHVITFKHIPREENKEADKMVNQALDAEQKQLF